MGRIDPLVFCEEDSISMNRNLIKIEKILSCFRILLRERERERERERGRRIMQFLKERSEREEEMKYEPGGKRKSLGERGT